MDTNRPIKDPTVDRTLEQIEKFSADGHTRTLLATGTYPVLHLHRLDDDEQGAGLDGEAGRGQHLGDAAVHGVLTSKSCSLSRQVPDCRTIVAVKFSHPAAIRAATRRRAPSRSGPPC